MSPGIEQRGQASVDDLAAADADEDALDFAKAVALGLMANGFDGGLDAERLGIAVMAIDHGLQHRFDHVRRGVKVELTGIADVEVENLVTLAGDFVGGNGQIANGVAHVRHAAGGQHFRNSFRSHEGFPWTASL